MKIDEVTRFRGRAAQCHDGEYSGKWFFEMEMCFLGQDGWKDLGQFGPWDSKEKALYELRHAAKICVETFQKHAGWPVGSYVDMKTNKIEFFEEEN